MIETKLISYLQTSLGVPVYLEIPADTSGKFVVIERTGGSGDSKLFYSTFAIQSYGPQLSDAIELNESVMQSMESFPTDDLITAVSLNSYYNFTNTTTKQRRYQAVYNITHY